MTTYIQDSAPARRLLAWAIVDKRGQCLATVQALYPTDGMGRLKVEVRNTGAGLKRALKRPYFRKIAEAVDTSGNEPWCQGPEWAAHDLWGFQRGAASGCGYDKLAAALSCLVVAGHTIADHCGHVPEDERKRARLMAAYKRAAPGDRKEWDAKACAIGCSFANWREGEGWRSLFFMPGLQRLESFGLTVIQTI